jgi:hypothetical protein
MIKVYFRVIYDDTSPTVAAIGSDWNLKMQKLATIADIFFSVDIVRQKNKKIFVN